MNATRLRRQIDTDRTTLKINAQRMIHRLQKLVDALECEEPLTGLPFTSAGIIVTPTGGADAMEQLVARIVAFETILAVELPRTAKEA